MREVRDVQPKYVAYFGVVLALLILVVFLAAAWLFRFFATNQIATNPARTQLAPESTQPPEPRLQVSPEADNRDYIERERQILNQYGWIDRNKGIARIPISRAMDIVVERGIR